MGTVAFFTEGISFKLSNKRNIRKWVGTVVRQEGYSLAHLNFIFCSDEYLLSVNQQYLSHNYYTDIITFNNSDSSEVIEGDIFVSIDRVQENALSSHIDFQIELQRVIIHGVLHLLGYDDHSPTDIQMIRQKEDSYLSLLNK